MLSRSECAAEKGASGVVANRRQAYHHRMYRVGGIAMRKISLSSCALLALSVLAGGSADAAVYGPCRFNSASLAFDGSVADTAACLLRRVKEKGAGAVAQPVPPWLLSHITRSVDITPAQVSAYLSAHSIAPGDLTSQLTAGDTPTRRYFVIHDTSSPEIPGTSFPATINEQSYSGNALTGWTDTSRRVNLITSRDGRSRLFQDWSRSRPAPATKIEQNSMVPAARERFVHVENIQPRLNPDHTFFWQAPNPGFAPAQEQRLALAYVIASSRAGHWLIPAYHFNIDEGIANGHDDPQHADLASWVARVETIVAEMTARAPGQPH